MKLNAARWSPRMRFWRSSAADEAVSRRVLSGPRGDASSVSVTRHWTGASRTLKPVSVGRQDVPVVEDVPDQSREREQREGSAERDEPLGLGGRAFHDQRDLPPNSEKIESKP